MKAMQIVSLSLSILILGCIQQADPVPQFRSETIDDKVQIGYGLAIGDVDGDGKADILLADKKQFVWYRNPDWQRFVMVDSLTEKDNVCIAARDINGDGQVEVAVGAQWNPGETSDKSLSGSVHYLIRPEDPTQQWEAIPLYHEPTIHRMRWIKAGDSFQLAVLPLHGIANQQGEGTSVNLLTYTFPSDPKANWEYDTYPLYMHITHNMDLIQHDGQEALLIGGKEGAQIFSLKNNPQEKDRNISLLIDDFGFGEIRKQTDMIAGIQPLHGNMLVVYQDGQRKLLTDSLAQGHALALADLLKQGQDQLIVGWRNLNQNEEIGIKLFIGADPNWTAWKSIWIDKNEMACEDLKIADLNGDAKPDIIAAGRRTNNLKIYWNESK